MTEAFINVHDFDGKLKNKFKPTITVSNKEKIEIFDILKSLLVSHLAIEMVDIIKRDLDTNLNFQQENNIDCSDVLANFLIEYKPKTKTNTEWIIPENIPLLSMLEEQLIDIITLGSCPSGRCTRLLALQVGGAPPTTPL